MDRVAGQQIRSELIKELGGIIQQKIDDAYLTKEALEDSKQNETKSSMGDKYETGRAMIQQELDKTDRSILQNQELLVSLNSIDQKKEYNHPQTGSIVVTNQGIFFISIGYGMLKYNEHDYFVISDLSPIGKELSTKNRGDGFHFMNKYYHIEAIV